MSTCSKCGADADEAQVHSWHLAGVTDYRRKIQRFLGFPSGEVHTIQGWRIDDVGPVDVRLCHDCVAEISADAARRKPAAMHKLRRALGIEAALVVTWILMRVVGATGFPSLLAATAVVVFAIVCATRGFQLWNLGESHQIGLVERGIAIGEAEKLAPQTTLPIVEMFFLPTDVGQYFLVEAGNWKQLSDGYRQCREETGWSHFEYTREFAYSKEELDRFEGAKRLGEDLGVFLDSDEMGELDED